MNRFVAPAGRWLVTALLVVAAIVVALGLWRHYETDPWTRDGHVRADVVRVTTDVPGLVTQVLVRDNQMVHKGDLLFVVDRPRFSAALKQADANVASARATLNQARKEARRDLALGDLVATETHEQNLAKVETGGAAVAQALAARETAQLNLERTAVHAPVDGQVTNLDLHPGDFLAAGAQGLALIDQSSLRIEGYFEETKLSRIPIGAQVRIHLMGDPGTLYGHVESIAGGIADDQSKPTGNQLQAVNPTFSWVRLAQRIPVRIHVDRMPKGTQLIPGRTATVTIVQPAPGR
jgi:RND family efflux transporter MFP subunit